MGSRHEVLIGNSGRDYVRFYDIGKPDQEDWFDAAVEVQCDGWRGKFRASFLRGDLRGFAGELERLRSVLGGRAQLRPIENQIILDVTGDGKGHFPFKGEAVNNFDRQTSLNFSFEIDQTYLPRIVASLRKADPV